MTLFVSNFPKKSFLACCKWQWHIHCANDLVTELVSQPTVRRGWKMTHSQPYRMEAVEVLPHQVLGNAGIFSYTEMPVWSRESAWAKRGLAVGWGTLLLGLWNSSLS